MIITVTSIELKTIWKYFRLSWFGLQIMRQLKGEKGFVKMDKSGSGKLHFTLTVWENTDDMKRFARSGAHLLAMKASREIAQETRSYTFESDTIPDWSTAKKWLFEKGRVISNRPKDK